MTEIVFVGTGDAFGSGGRRNSAIVVREKGRSLLLDCGPTTLGGMKLLGLDPREVEAVVITHFHGDHVAGIPFLLLDAIYESPRSTPLTIYGPPGIQARVSSMCRDFSYLREQEQIFEATYRELDVQRSHDVAGFRLEAHPAYHHPETRPHMVALTNSSTRVFYTGDTGWHESLPDRVGDADLLITECVYYDPKFEYHLSVRELEAHRRRLRARRTILTHLGSEVLSERDRCPFDTAEDGLQTAV